MKQRKILAIAITKNNNQFQTNNDVFSRLGLGSVSAWIFGAIAALMAMTLLLNGDGLTAEGDNILVAVAWQILAAALLIMRWYRGKPLESETQNGGGFRWYDVAAACFFVWIGISFVVVWFAETGSPRAMLTMLSHWCGFAAMFVIGRLLLNNSMMIRGMLFLFAALTIAESAAAYYDYCYLAPKHRQEFYANREETFRMNNALTPGEQQLLEARIQSPEPLGTYSLTNSLAGVLVPWCVFFFGVSLAFFSHNVPNQQNNKQNNNLKETPRLRVSVKKIFLPLLLFAILFVLLFLTKSRSGLLAVLFAITLLMICFLAHKIRRRGFLLGIFIGISIALFGVFGGLFASGKITTEHINNATKSLGYRLQYWQSSLAMIHDHPFFGCGVGNFKEFYTLYKLPTASETVSDPHNLFFETASNAGLPAGVGLFVLIAAALVHPFIARKQNETCETTDFSQQSKTYSFRNFRPLIFGGGIGILAAAIYSYTNYDPMKTDTAIVCLFGFGIACLLVLPMIIHLPPNIEKLAPICLLALMINLLAAGGIAFPHVNIAFWFLLALCLKNEETLDDEETLRTTNQQTNIQKYSYQNSKQNNFGQKILKYFFDKIKSISIILSCQSCKSCQKINSSLCYLCLSGVFVITSSAFYFTAFLPNLQANMILRALQDNTFQNAYLDRRVVQLENALQLDSYRTDAWTALCRDLLAQHREFDNPQNRPNNSQTQQSPNVSAFRELLISLNARVQHSCDAATLKTLTIPDDVARAALNVIRTAPSSATRLEELGMIFFDDYQKTRNAASLTIAIILLERAAMLYPNHSTVYVNLALCYAASNASDLTRVSARRALELDAITPHADRKLPKEIREQVMELGR